MLEFVCLNPGVAEMSKPTSAWYTKLKGTLGSRWKPRTPKYERLVEMAGIQPKFPTGGVEPFSSKLLTSFDVSSNEMSRLP